MPRPAKYPWATWLDPKQHPRGLSLVCGVSISPDTNPVSLREQIYREAKLRGVSVRVRINYDTGRTFQSMMVRVTSKLSLEPYFDGQTHRLARSDFPGLAPYEFQEQILAEAARRGVEMKFRVEDDGSVSLRAVMISYPPNHSPAAPENDIPELPSGTGVVAPQESAEAQPFEPEVEDRYASHYGPQVAEDGLFDYGEPPPIDFAAYATKPRPIVRDLEAEEAATWKGPA